MAVEVEAAGQVDEFLRVLKKRVWWIVLPFVLIGSLGCFFAVVVPKKYVSFTEILVTEGGSTTELARARSTDNEGKLAPFTIRAPARIEKILRELNWSDYKALSGPDAKEYVRERLRDLKVTLPTMPDKVRQQLVTISYRDTDLNRAHQFLLALKRSWTEEVLLSKRNVAEKELAEANEEYLNHEADLQKVTEEMRELRSENEIPPPTPFMQSAEEARPAVFRRLDRVQQELLDQETRMEELNGSIELLTLERDSLPRTQAVGENSVQSPIDRQIEAADEAIAALALSLQTGGYSSSHSEYKKRRRKIDELESKRDQLLALRDTALRRQFGSDDTEENPAWVALDERARKLQFQRETLQTTIDRNTRRARELEAKSEQAQTALAELDRLNATRVSLAENMITLQKSRSALQRRLGILQSSQGNPFRVQQEPLVPTEPTAPNPWVIAIGSLIFGLGLGLGLALLKEFSKNCFRSARDLSRVMTHPVLGKVNEIRTRRDRARSLFVQSVLGGGSLLFALSTAYVTWSWAMNRDGLTESLVDAITSFQQLLK